MSEILDLFGDPIPQNWGGRGRPAHVPTLENRNKIKLLLALGWGNERIARSLGITANTLRKHYLRELKVRGEARDRMDARLAWLLWQQVSAGNVAAMKEFQKLVERNDRAVGYPVGADSDAATSETVARPQMARLGKKEEATIAAQTAGQDTDWGDDLRPLGLH
jgi:hypothetical protein